MRNNRISIFNRHTLNSYHDIEAQFEKLFDENYRRLIFHALLFVDSQEEAEDIVSDAYLRAVMSK